MSPYEFSLYVDAVRTYYHRETILPNQAAMDLWYEELKDIPYQVAKVSLRRWVQTNKWSPSIAEIRESCMEVLYPDRIPWGKAWEQVLDAIKNRSRTKDGNYLEGMCDTAKKVVKQMGFRNICMSENLATERANFRMIYESLQEKEKLDIVVSPGIREAIKQVQLSEIKKLEEGNGTVS